MESEQRDLTIITRRFEVKAPRPEMIGNEFMGWVNQNAIKRQFPYFAKPETLEELRALIERLSSPYWKLLIIRERDTGEGVGFIFFSINSAHAAITHHALGNRKWWGKGVIYEVRAGLIEVLFRNGIRKIVGLPKASSRSAIIAYRDQGFIQEGILRDHIRNDDGTYDDAIAFGLLRGEWDFKKASQIPESIRARLARTTKRKSANASMER